MSEESEGWTKPSDVMKNRRKRKILVRSRSMDFQKSLPKSVLSPEVPTSRLSGPVKRRNPFGCSDHPAKRSSSEQENDLKTASSALSGSILFDGLNAVTQDKGSEVPEVQPDVTNTNPYHCTNGASVLQKKPLQVSNQVTTKLDGGDVKDVPKTTHRHCPADWCLRTRLRFVSPSPFTWCANLKGSEETAGVSAFVRGPEQSPHLKSDSLEAKSSFQRHTMYWVHPHIPWLKLFPRIRTDTKIGAAGLVMQSDEVQKSLMADWSSSFTSVFHQLRCGLCPYFYVCTHQFSVIFRAAAVGGYAQPHAILTPTSRGFREALKNEGISFTMPLAPKGMDMQAEDELADSSENQPSESSDKAACSEDVEEGADEREWLESIGISAAKFRALDPIKIKLQKEGYRIIDHRPESMLLMEGADCQALFNYLLNCRSCVAVTGPQAGLPPTLLAPTPFQGATLQSLKTKCSSVRQAHGTPAYSVELSGPILPHVLHNLTDLFTSTQKEFTCVGSIHEPTTPFNAATNTSQDDQSTPDPIASGEDQSSPPEVPKSLLNSGLPLVHLQNILREQGLGKSALRELSYKDDEYSWVM